MGEGTKQYWGSLPVEQMLPEAEKRIDEWFKHVKYSGRLGIWRLSLNEYYAGVRTLGKVQVTGEQEELTTIKVNHYHNLGEHLVTAIAGQPPTFQPQASNNDHQSTSETIVAGGLLESAVTQKGLEPVSVNATRSAVTLSEGWGAVYWDTTLGEDYARDPDSGQNAKTGDVRYKEFNPLDIIRDPTKEGPDDHTWWILRTYENRYDVAARIRQKAEAEQDPEKQKSLLDMIDKIMALPSKIDEQAEKPRLSQALDAQRETEDVAVYELRHGPTPACPEGRLCVFLSADVYLGDGPLGYRAPYVFRMAPEDEIGTAHGYTQAFDLLAPQHAINATYSTMLSNLSAFGVQSIWLRPNNNVTTEELGKGLTVIKSNEKPEPLNLVQTPKEIPEFAKDLIGQMEVLSGVNAVRRGNLDAAGKLSGAAYALIDAKFLEYAAGLQKSYRMWMAKMATATVEVFQDFATADFTVQIVGKSKRPAVKTFNGAGLKRIRRVDVEMGNPLSRTVSGRLQTVDTLMKMVDPTGKPVLKTPEQIFQVLTTGRLEPVTEGPAAELDNIKAENEVLSEGKPARVLAIDNHPLHIQEHYAVVASPEARETEQVASAVLAHCAEHHAAWIEVAMTNPGWLAARGIPMPPMPPAPPMPPGGDVTAPGAPGATDGTLPPEPGATDVTAAPPPGAGEQPGMPSMPTNPQTGESAPAPAMA